MNKYKVTFQSEEGYYKVLTVKAEGIIPAIEEAISQMFGKAMLGKTHGIFYYPVKAEEV